MCEAEEQLRQFIKERSLKFGEVQLSSGDKSDYYIDGKMIEVWSKGAHLIGEVLYERTHTLGIQAIGGLEAGAIPLTTAAVISYHHHGREMEGFWVRDKAKSHGTKKMIEGALAHNSRVIILEDVVTKGSSAIKAVNEVRKIGCQVVAVFALVDRLCGARELFRQNGVENYCPIFTIADLGVGGHSGQKAEAASL